MKEFMLVFRGDYKAIPQNDPGGFKDLSKRWNDWIDELTLKDKWVAAGQQLSPKGKVVRSKDVITDGPYTETKEILMSFCIIKADSLEEAAELSKSCPILIMGGNVEVRELMAFKSNI
jgi:hypothetical protein